MSIKEAESDTIREEAIADIRRRLPGASDGAAAQLVQVLRALLADRDALAAAPTALRLVEAV